MTTPRDYQANCRDIVLDSFAQYQSVLTVLATGLGKTRLLGYVAREFRRSHQFHGKVLLLAHREELITQGQRALEEETGEHFEIEMADYHVDMRTLFGSSAGVVASVQSLSRERRIGKDVFKPEHFGLIIVDEAHHCVPKNKQYSSIVKHFMQNPNCRMLGLTATPDRADEEALGQMFQYCAFDYGIAPAINDGWLVPIRQSLVTVADLDFSSIKTTAGDLNAAQLEAVMNEEKTLHRIVAPTIELAAGRQTLMFSPGVENAHKMAEIFNRHRAGMAVALDGETDKLIRADELKKFGRKEFQVLINCGLFLEGTDIPGVEVVGIGRPTESRSLYAQMIGRGTRPLPGVVDFEGSTPMLRKQAIAASPKPGVLVIDFMGNAGKHKLMHVGDVLAGECSDEVADRAKQIAVNRSAQGLDTDMLMAVEQAKKEREEADRRRRREIIARASFVVRDISPFDALDLSAGREPGFMRGKTASPKQVAWLRAKGVPNVDPKLSMHKASKLIDEVKRREESGLCNPRQAARLSAFGKPTNVTDAEARRLIQEINESLRQDRDTQTASRRGQLTR